MVPVYKETMWTFQGGMFNVCMYQGAVKIHEITFQWWPQLLAKSQSFSSKNYKLSIASRDLIFHQAVFTDKTNAVTK